MNSNANTVVIGSHSARVAEVHHSDLGIRTRQLVDAINSHAGVVLIALTCLYFGITIALASIKLLWLDEFITFYIAKLGSVRAIWTALSHGADPNPPLSHLLVLFSSKLFGESALALRIPALISSWVGIAALYTFLKRRVAPLYACAGALFFMSTAAFDYSFESRSYAFLLCFSALSLLAWQSTIEGNHKNWSAVGLALALAAGLSSNYFAVLAFFPIAAGELVRDVSRREIQWRVWAAMAVAGSTLLVYLPLINKAVSTFSPYAWNKVQLDVIADSYLEMVEVILWPALALLAIAAVVILIARHRPNRPVLPRHEAVAAFVLMIYPFIAYTIAHIRGGMLSPRFVIPMCFGFAIAVAAAAYRLLHRWPVAGLAFLTVLVGWVFAREGFVARMYYDQRLALYRVIDTLPPAPTIAVSDSLLVLPLHRYAPPEIASRIVFPVDFSAIRQYKKEDSPEQNLWNGRNGIYPVPIIPVDQLAARSPDYVIAAPPGNWLVRTLIAENRPPHLLPIFTDTKDIQGFTPLCHGPVWLFAHEKENSVAADSRDDSSQTKASEIHEKAH